MLDFSVLRVACLLKGKSCILVASQVLHMVFFLVFDSEFQI